MAETRYEQFKFSQAIIPTEVTESTDQFSHPGHLHTERSDTSRPLIIGSEAPSRWMEVCRAEGITEYDQEMRVGRKAGAATPGT